MTLNNIQIYLEDQKLTVVVDLLIEHLTDEASHPDNPIPSTVKDVQVLKVHSVNYLAMDCVDIDLTLKFRKDTQLSRKLENVIVEEVEFMSIDQLKTAA